MTALRSGHSAGTDLRPALGAARAHLGLVLILFALAALGWWWTSTRMQDMDNGPWTGLGTFGWFLGLWVVMMAAMMFPSVAPTVALDAQMSGRMLAPFLFASGYLLSWAAAGVIAFCVGMVGSYAVPDFEWEDAGRLLTGATLITAAAYELSPLKNVCLGKCRSPLGVLLGSWRGGRFGALRMGTRNGAWCVGCCWALMAALFALGVMSSLWMAVVASLIAAEKILPWRRIATYGTAGVLLALGVMVLLVPAAVPLTIPGSRPM